MENNGISSDSHGNSGGSNNNSNNENSTVNHVFINHAEVTWHEIRKQWVGDPSQKPPKVPREQIMSWTTTYEDLLCSSEPFQQRIPLAEMVDFLVDIWHEEGLFD